MDTRSAITLLISLALFGVNSVPAALRVSSDFEGGSARVLAVNAETQFLRISPDGDPGRGMPNWWYVRVDGIDTNQLFTLEVVARDASTPSEDGRAHSPLAPGWTLPDRAAWSTDGAVWRQTAAGERSGNRSVYRIPTTSTTLRLAWGPPFTPGDAGAWIDGIARAHSSFAKPFTLAESREKRPVRGLRISAGVKPSAQRPAVWIHARQHAWECGSSWVAVGLVEWLTGPELEAAWLRESAEVFVVPIMDVDHVATGDGGKHARPQDHNRDWSDAPHWPEVAAAQQRILELAREQRMTVFLDLHNPSPGARVQTFYVQYPPYVGPLMAETQERFISHLRSGFGDIRLIDGKPGRPEHLPVWKRISTPWVCENANPDTVSLTVETPWNTLQGTTDGYKETGRKLGQATARFLKNR